MIEVLAVQESSWADNPLLGVAIGFVLGFLGSWWLEHRRNCELAKSVRVMMRLELARNTQAIARLWANVPKPMKMDPGQIKIEEENGYTITDLWNMDRQNRARDFIRAPFPDIDRHVWERHTAAIPAALSSAEIERVDGFYDGIDQIEAIRATFIGASDADTIHGRSVSVSQMARMPDRFYGQVVSYWDDLERLVGDVLQKGNQGLPGPPP